MRRPSLRWSGRSTDGSTSPSPGPSTTPSSNVRGSSYFTSKAVKRGKKVSEDSPSYSYPLSSFWKQSSLEIEESPRGTIIENTPEDAASPKSPGQNVQDWNITRLFDPIPYDSSQEKLGQGPSHNSNWKDWNVTRSYDVKPSASQQSIDPPRPAREGYEWVWFPAGYWAERELPGFLSPPTNSEGRKNDKGNFFWRTPDRKSNDSEDSTSPRGSRRFWGSLSSKVSKQVSGQSFMGSAQGSAISSSKSERFLNKLQSMSPTYPRYVSPSGDLEGLYCKTKRNLSSKRHLAAPFIRKRKPKIDTPSVPCSHRTPSTAHTAGVLEGVVGYFDTFGHQNTIDPSTMTPSSSDASVGSRRRWRFGNALWHRRLSDNSISASSSIFELLAGKTPLVTPKSESCYVSATGKSYMKVEISDPDAPTFLPSEARRIDTPLWSPKRDPRRGFLSNMFPYEQKPLETQCLGTTRPRRNTTRSSLRNLLKTPTLLTSSNHPESSDSEKSPKVMSNPSTIRSFKSQDFSKANTFELNVPDHLPNSPLCPANPKHPSKGQGICPLHGRSRSRGQSPNVSRNHTPDGSQRHSANWSRRQTPDIEITVTAD